MNQAFREYATRVSFNLSLSRNQIYVLWTVSTYKNGWPNKHKEFGVQHDLFVPGVKWLISHGFVNYTNEEYSLTEAGEATLNLVRIAGLIPQHLMILEAA